MTTMSDTLVKVSLDTNDVQYGEEPYWVMTFESANSSSDSSADIFSARFLFYGYGILQIHGIQSLIAPKKIIELLCGCFMPGSNIDHALKASKRIPPSAKVKSIALDLNGVPISVSYYHHNPESIFSDWQDILQGKSIS